MNKPLTEDDVVRKITEELESILNLIKNGEKLDEKMSPHLLKYLLRNCISRKYKYRKL